VCHARQPFVLIFFQNRILTHFSQVRIFNPNHLICRLPFAVDRTMAMKRRPSFLNFIALLLPFQEVSSLSHESSSISSVSSASSLLLSRRRALASVAAAGGVSAFWPSFVSPVEAVAPSTDALANSASTAATPLSPAETATTASDYFPFESRDRNGNKNTVIREDYWYMMGKTPPRQLLNPLKGDNPQFNAYGSCESAVEGGGNPCTYISLKQRAPAYSKYASSILAGSQEYQALGRLLQQLRTPAKGAESFSIDASWQEAALYVVIEEHSPPPPIVDAELKMILFATAMTTSPNFPGPSRELLVSRFYVNEAHYAHIVIKHAILSRDVDAALQAWQFGRDSWNSYFQAVSRSIVPKVGEPFAPIAAIV
jgi:hypothetical protein